MDTAITLSSIFGLFVGTSLGLTGGGGSIFAVPLLIYGLAVPVDTAKGLSLAAVGITAAFGAFLRIWKGDVEWKPGLIFALGSMATAPLGCLIGRHTPHVVQLSSFALLMVFVGVRMWRGRSAQPEASSQQARLDTRRLGGGGAAAGLLTGFFGVGGGFIIVPVLLSGTGMSIHRAAATSLLVIFLTSLSGVATELWNGQTFPMPVTGLFVAGGFAGMLFGNALRPRFSGKSLQKAFSLAMWVGGAWLLLENLIIKG